MNGPKPQPEDYRFLIEREWADIHHSRLQEWSALGVVAASHFALFQLFDFASKFAPSQVSAVAMAGLSFGVLFSLLGVLITCRHSHLMRTKLTWIFEAEDHLGLIKDAENPGGIIPRALKAPKPSERVRLALPRPLSTGGLIICLYLLLGAFDAIGITLLSR